MICPTPRTDAVNAEHYESAWHGYTTMMENALELERELAEANRPASVSNPLHEILEEMDSRGGNAIQRLAAYIRACGPKRKAKALIAFRDDLECYDRKLAPTTHPETPVV